MTPRRGTEPASAVAEVGPSLLAEPAARPRPVSGARAERLARLLHPDDADAAVLEAQLRRLGYRVCRQWPPVEEAAAEAPAGLLVIRISGDDLAAAGPCIAAHGGLALGLLDTPEARLIERLAGLGLHGVLLRPFRYPALQAQLAVAQAQFAFQQRLQDKVLHLETQLRARRSIEHATRILMVVHEAGAEQAYELLRRRAMDLRLSLVETAEQLIGRARTN